MGNNIFSLVIVIGYYTATLLYLLQYQLYFQGKVYRAGCRLEPQNHPTVEFRSSHSLLAGRTYVMQDGSQVVARCRDLHNVFTGENIITCGDGQWSSSLPRCTKTYQAWRGFGVLRELTYIMSCVEAVFTNTPEPRIQ